MQEFHYTNYAQEVIFGTGSLAHLSEAIERFGWRQLMLCSSGSLRRDGIIEVLEKALGDRLVAVYERTQPHVPDFQVEEARELAEAREVDAIIGMGGGSPIGMAKAVSFALEGQGGSTSKGMTGASMVVTSIAGASVAEAGMAPARGATTNQRETQRAPGMLAQPRVPVVAIPTTYAGSEMTPVYGVTRQVDGQARKLTVSDARITPKLVIYDPRLTLGLSPSLTASTGINALAHCIEALYSITRNPLSTAAALSGIRSIMYALPRCYAEGADLEARTEMLEGAFLAGTALAHVTMALHHGLCHVLGGTAGVPHGIANSIILPHATRFNLDATALLLAPAAEVMGISLAGRGAEEAGEEAVQRIYEMIGGMNLPQHLRDAGVQEAELPHLAQLAFQSRTVQSNPKPITAVSQIEEILRAAW